MTEDIDEIKKIIAQGHIHLALDKIAMLDAITSKDKFVSISHQYNNVKSQYIKNLISIDEYNRNLSIVTDRLINFINTACDDPHSKYEKKHSKKENKSLSYVELEQQIDELCVKIDQYHFEDIVSMTKSVIEYCAHHFNSNNFEDCNHMYLYFIDKMKGESLEYIKYRMDCDRICRDYMFESLNGFEKDSESLENERKYGQHLRSVVDTILECEAYLKSIEEFDETILKFRDTYTALHGEVVMEIIESAMDLIMNFQKRGSSLLAYHLSMNYLNTLSEYFRKQKYWLNPSQKRISLSISDDIIQLYQQGINLENTDFANFIMTYNRLMSDINGMMEMNLEFYQDDQNNQIDL